MRHDTHRNVGVSIDDVMKLMTVNSPDSRIRRHKFHITGRARRHIDRISRPLGRLGNGPSLSANDFPGVAMEVDWMTAHGQVAKSDPNPIPFGDRYDVDVWSHLPIEGKPIKIHGHQIRSIVAG